MSSSSSSSSRVSTMVKWGSIPAGLAVSGLLIWQASYAAFSDTTTNPGNNWQAGSVVITDDDAGAAMFTAKNLAPGDTGTKCITGTYSGSLDADLRFYAANASSSNGMAENIDLTIIPGTAGAGDAFGSCAGFVPYEATPKVYEGTLANLTATKTNFNNGIVAGDNVAGGTDAAITYKFVYTFSADAPESVQNGTAAADFTWEAQSISGGQ